MTEISRPSLQAVSQAVEFGSSDSSILIPYLDIYKY